ncbi:MAG TPA: hypothetical protein VMW87_04555 [Spirochaetia bacterium]|nr:hypothetical protein [Spirochaetia bacterium]
MVSVALMRQGFLDAAGRKRGTKATYLAYYDHLFDAAMGTSSAAPAAMRIIADVLLTPNLMVEVEKAAQRDRLQRTDLLCYTISQGAFDIQRQVIESTSTRIYCMAGRRAGKTEAAARKLARTIARGGRGAYIGKTWTVAMDRVWNLVREVLDRTGVLVTDSRRTDGYCRFATGGELWIFGNANSEDRERRRGEKYDLIVIDEAQSQQALTYFIDSVLEPMLLDSGGTLMLIGTGPRVRGTYWEVLWSKDDQALRLNWDLRANPYIKNHETVLEEILRDKALTLNSPLFQREYLGQIAYDDDALVCRLTESNYYTWADLIAWITTQPKIDLHFTGGIDYGMADADAIEILLYSTHKPEQWVVWEYKQRGNGVTEIVEAVKRGLQFVQTDRVFAEIPDKDFFFYADESDLKITLEMNTVYGLPVVGAFKADKEAQIQLLQDDVRRGLLKILKGGPIDEEALRTVFARNDRDELTREIDSEAYHPDAMDALRYARQPVVIFGGQTR